MMGVGAGVTGPCVGGTGDGGMPGALVGVGAGGTGPCVGAGVTGPCVGGTGDGGMPGALVGVGAGGTGSVCGSIWHWGSGTHFSSVNGLRLHSPLTAGSGKVNWNRPVLMSVGGAASVESPNKN